MAAVNGNIAVPGGQIGSGEAQVFNPMPTLNVLAGFQNREDQQAKLDAIERMKAEALKAKAEKDAADVKYPVLDVSKAGIWNNQATDAISKIHQTAISEIAKDPANAQLAATVAARAKNEIANINNANEQATKGFTETAKTLSDQGYVVNPNELAAAYDTPDWFRKDISSDLANKVKTNPKNFNFAMLGDLAASKAKTKTIKRIGIDGSEHDETVPMFANVNKRTNALEIKSTEALKYLGQIPSVKEQLPYVFKEVAEAEKVDPSIFNKPENELTAAEKGTILDLQNKVVDRYLGGRLGYTVVNDYNTDENKAKNEANGAKLAGYQEVETPIKINYNTKYQDGSSYQVPINWGVGKSISLPKPAKIGSNRKVYVLGGDMDNLGDLATKQNDGSYLLNFGFEVKEFQRPKNVLQLTKDTRVRMPDGSVKIREKGSFITPNEAKSLDKIGQGDHFKKVNGYRISPGSLRVDEETERKIGPAFQGIDVFIPAGIGEMPELENANPRKAPVTESETIDIGL